MNELEIAKNALEQIIGYYRRSHKHGENTCYMMCLEAERALREMSLLTKRALDGAGLCPECSVPQVVVHKPNCSHYESPRK
jgi:hypothetical protein